MDPFTIGLVAVGTIAIVRSLTRPNSKNTKKDIQRISEQAREDIRRAGENYSAQARALAQSQKRK